MSYLKGYKGFWNCESSGYTQRKSSWVSRARFPMKQPYGSIGMCRV